MRCYISENQTIFYRRVDHKYYYEAKTNWTQLWASSAVSSQRFLQLSSKNILFRKPPLMAMTLGAKTNKVQQLLSSVVTIDNAIVCRQTLPAYLVHFHFIIVFTVYTSTENRLVLADIIMHRSHSQINKQPMTCILPFRSYN